MEIVGNLGIFENLQIEIEIFGEIVNTNLV